MGKPEMVDGDPMDKTGQIRLLSESVSEKADAKTVKFWLGFLGLVAAAAWGAAVYFGGFAKNDSVTSAIDRTNARIDSTNDRIGKVEAQQAAQSATSIRIEDDLHWLRQQEAENAKATGAKAVPQLQHDEERKR